MRRPTADHIRRLAANHVRWPAPGRQLVGGRLGGRLGAWSAVGRRPVGGRSAVSRRSAGGRSAVGGRPAVSRRSAGRRSAVSGQSCSAAGRRPPGTGGSSSRSENLSHVPKRNLCVLVVPQRHYSLLGEHLLRRDNAHLCVRCPSLQSWFLGVHALHFEGGGAVFKRHSLTEHLICT